MKLEQVEGSFETSEDGRFGVAAGGMVASAFPEATFAGVRMLQEGGNAADAACAVGFALGVCEPQMSGVGGQTLGLLHFDGKTIAMDGSSRVPSLAHLSRLDGAGRETGYGAATVPSTVAALAWLHERHGRLPWKTILEPAVEVAREGYRIPGFQASLQARELTSFLSVPSRSGARYFLKDGERPYAEGDQFRQGDLSRLLEQLAKAGARDFYQGEIAAQIDADMRDNDGFLRRDDLALIPWPVVREPLERQFRSVTVAAMPPPGSGRTLLLLLLMLNHLESRVLPSLSGEAVHFIAETFRKALVQRAERPFDPNTYPQIRDKRMLSRSFAVGLASSIAEGIDPSLPRDLAGAHLDESGETTHFSVMDEEGNVASITQSIERAYGSKAAAEGLGFLYNNYMMALDVEDPGHPYYLRPNAVPWSSAASAIVFHDGRPWIAFGSPGSERIYTSMSQFLMHVVDDSASIADAVQRPRLHCSIGGTVSLEVSRFPADVVQRLERHGYTIDPCEAYSPALGCIQAALRCQTRPGFQGVADPRRNGTAAGPPRRLSGES